MRRSRREFTVAAAAAAFWPTTPRADPMQPIIIALGETEDSPAASKGGYLRAIQAGADFIETRLLPSQDGALIACAERELSGFTDVTGRSEFASRKTSKPVHGVAQSGWFIEDFSLGELQTLKLTKSAWPVSHQPNILLTFQDVVDIARAGSVRNARVIGVYVGLIEPGYFDSLELPVEPHLADAIKVAGYNSPAAAMFVHASEPAALITLRGLCRTRLVRRLTDAATSDAISPEGLADVRTYADVLAPDADLVDAPAEGASLLARSRAAGFALHAWAPVSKRHRRDYEAWLAGFFSKGVDGLASDGPQAAAGARREAARR